MNSSSPEINSIVDYTHYKKLYSSSSSYSPYEIVDNALWTPGYSIYLTHWCKRYLALQIYRQKELSSIDSIDSIYRDILSIWAIHHLPNTENNYPIPIPPRPFHLQQAYSYFLKISSIDDSILPSSSSLFHSSFLSHLKSLFSFISSSQ